MAVSRRLRFEVLRRDNYTCRYCGASAPDVKLTVDHVNPSSLGGEDRPENLVTACDSCNGGKSSIPPDAGVVANVAADALRWAEAMLKAADEAIEDIDRRNEARAEFDEAWSVWGVGPEGARRPIPRPNDWELSVDRFIAAGLPMAILLDCVDKAMRNSKVRPDATFRYMCGIAWKKVQQLQEAARESLAAGGAPAVTADHVDRTAMYRELVGHIFGRLFGVGSEADVKTLALARLTSLEEAEEANAFDEEGHAAVEVIERTADIWTDHHTAAHLLLGLLPADVIDGFHDRAVHELNWHPALTSADGGVLYREALSARMLFMWAQQLLNDSGEGSE